MARLFTVLGVLALLAFLALSFDGVPSLPTRARRPRAATAGEGEEAPDEAAAAGDGEEAPDEAAVAATEAASAEPEAAPVPPRPSRRRRAIGAVSWLVFLAVVIGAIVAIPRALTWALDSPYPMAAVSGSSMWPTLHKGDLVFIKGVDDVEDLQVGDIISFRQDRGFSIHRVMKIEGEVITTRGDGNFGDDPPITVDDVMGKVPKVWGRLARVPFLGNLSLIFGPAVRRDNDFRPQEERLLSQPVLDLAEEDSGRILRPVDDLAKRGTADASEGSPGASGERRPVADLSKEIPVLDSAATTGSPIEDLAQPKQ